MEGLNLVSTFAEFKDQKNIDRATMMGVLEDVFLSQLKKMYSENSDFDIIINIDKGDLQIFWNRVSAWLFCVIIPSQIGQTRMGMVPGGG